MWVIKFKLFPYSSVMGDESIDSLKLPETWFPLPHLILYVFFNVNRKNCAINSVHHKFWLSDETIGYKECEYAISAHQIKHKARY